MTLNAPLIAFTILSTLPSYAASSASIVTAVRRTAESPISIVMPAEYIATEIRIESQNDDWVTKLEEIQETRQSLIYASEKEGFRVKIDQALIFEGRYSSFSFSSSSGTVETFSDVLVLVPINNQSKLIELLKRVRGMVGNLKPPKKVKVSFGNVFLALENPEDKRNDLLKKIRAHIDATAKITSESPDFLVNGLDEPLHVRQVSEREVEVYLPFRVTYTQKK